MSDLDHWTQSSKDFHDGIERHPRCKRCGYVSCAHYQRTYVNADALARVLEKCEERMLAQVRSLLTLP